MDIDFQVIYFSHQSRNPFALAPFFMVETDITFVHKGHLEYSLNGGKKFRVYAGQAVVFPAGCLRERFEGDEHAVYTSIILKHNGKFRFELPTIINGISNHEVKFCLDKLLDLSSEPNPFSDGMSDSIVKYLLYVLSNLALRENPPKKYVLDIQKFISNHYTRKISLKDIADNVHISQPYASSLFRKETGCSINTYITETRINAAERLLKYTDKSLSEIAVEVGFGELFYFSRVFKKKKGISPGEYRKNYLNGENRLVAMEIQHKEYILVN